MRKSIKFYKLVSPYTEDVTKGCGLLGSEIDQNFLNLKEMDIDTVSVETDSSGNTLIFKRVDGEEISVRIPDTTLPTDLSGYTKDLTVSFDKDKDELIFTYNGETHILSGLASTIVQETPVYSDTTLDGKGSMKSPLGINPVYMTGTYAPCIKLIDETIDGNKLPTSGLNSGDRYLTKEKFSPYGWYYNDCQMEKIDSFLKDNNTGWRVPTKSDWDSILDAAEFCDKYRNHTSTKLNADTSVGLVAGKRLKSVNGWTGDTTNIVVDGCECGEGCDDGCLKINTIGTDDFGFSVLAAGHADEYKAKIDNVSGCAYFWTSTNINGDENALYVKQLAQDLATVRQYSSNKSNYNSIRLVRNIEDGDVSPVEQIGDHNYETVTMPSWTPSIIIDESGNSATTWNKTSTVWTKTNLCGKFNLDTNPIISEEEFPEMSQIVYYVNYWNGTEWKRTELKEGYSVVLFNGISGDTENEYRVISGELINTSELVYGKVVDRLSATTFADIYEKISGNTSAITELSKNVVDNFKTTIDLIKEEVKLRYDADQNEISARTKADNDIKDELDLTEKALEEEVVKRQLEDGLLRTDIDSVSAGLGTFEETTAKLFEAVSDSIQKEKEERILSDNELSAMSVDNKNKVITGGTYDCSGGTLTLNTSNPDNNITVALNSNYGIYPYQD
jgi:uncharacterized protein (TIGR02145 family)